MMISKYPLLALATAGWLVEGKICSDQNKIAGVMSEIKTIRSHSVADAEAIPYAPEAYRVFTITPNETKPVSVFVPAGVDALTTRAVLVSLGTLLEAGVPQGSDHYSVNPNGTVTVDYIQTDGIALQKVDVREIHSFNSDCQITGITGYVRGNVEAFLGDLNIPKLFSEAKASA
ncbi:hypothetical protein VHEMI04505 [[Torrubiella] hemipterigena]|uniref:Uncharacterized protein n=1 Tax=[Torrubiella] hemipterigena TaxID=1531966 RepID=A0A0A1SVG6_9HYPO|nr:hypothetical protein VHEMI04505 [[Torrubiella] hemipterigena]